MVDKATILRQFWRKVSAAVLKIQIANTNWVYSLG